MQLPESVINVVFRLESVRGSVKITDKSRPSETASAG